MTAPHDSHFAVAVLLAEMTVLCRTDVVRSYPFRGRYAGFEIVEEGYAVVEDGGAGLLEGGEAVECLEICS